MSAQRNAPYSGLISERASHFLDEEGNVIKSIAIKSVEDASSGRVRQQAPKGAVKIIIK